MFQGEERVSVRIPEGCLGRESPRDSLLQSPSPEPEPEQGQGQEAESGRESEPGWEACGLRPTEHPR